VAKSDDGKHEQPTNEVSSAEGQAIPDIWLPKVERVQLLFERATAKNETVAVYDMATEFAKAIWTTNNLLGVMITMSSHGADGELPEKLEPWIKSSLSDLSCLMPLMQRIRKHLHPSWFRSDTVFAHSGFFSSTWNEIVMQAAQTSATLASISGPGRACKVLSDTGYDAMQVQANLRLELEFMTSAMTVPPDQRDWPTLSEAARWIGIERPAMFRLLSRKLIKDNDRRGTARKVNLKSLIDYCMNHGIVFDPSNNKSM
jgi:hypothetical protein